MSQSPANSESKTRRAGGRLGWLAALLLILVLLFSANQLIVRGKASCIWDSFQQFAPYQMLVADHARAGRFLLWNPLINGGAPDCGEPQMGAFSPLSVGLGAITGGSSLAWRAYWLTLWALGGLGILLLGRHLRAPAWGTAAVALGFIFSGVYTGHAEHLSRLHSFSLLPFVLWRLDAALTRRRLRPAFEAGAIWGLSALGGYPGLTITSAGFLILWVVGRLLFLKEENGRQPETAERPAAAGGGAGWGFGLLAVVLLLVVGLAVLSPSYTAFVAEGAGYTDRVGELGRELAVGSNAFHPGALTTLTSPYLSILKLADPKLWAYNDVSSCSIYLGAATAVLALLALLSRPRSGWRWWLLGLGLLSLALAMGRALPLRGWLYDIFLPARYFRHPAEMRDFFVLAASVLALLGVRDLAAALKGEAGKLLERFFIAAAVLAVVSILVFRMSLALAANAGPQAALAGDHIRFVWVGLCVAALAGWLLPKRGRFWAVPILLLILAGGDALMTSSLTRPTVYSQDPGLVNLWHDLDEKRDPSLDLTRRGLDRPLFHSCEGCLDTHNFPIKQPSFFGYTALNNRFHLRMAGHPAMWPVAVGPERIWFSREAARVSPSDGCFDAYLDRCLALRGRPPLAVHTRRDMLDLPGPGEAGPDDVAQRAALAQQPAAESLPIELIAYRPNELAFRVTCPASGWLLVSDRWARGWRATVDGQPAEVWGGNFIFRAIKVEAGAHAVRFTYHPFGYPWLLILSWVLMALAAVWAVWAAWPKRRA